ncbi:hypothetical protein DICVIV_12606 [Dictyocaulus viviparus]|uniref:SAM domain-containing protein n=1 Tax=Dictyocaulus viviparus TaxID=29172 RepID=A0A0D8XCN1_DICVI|nr:hypothetical protein DICVIV_12606 [Dictyocaulus viviparus]
MVRKAARSPSVTKNDVTTMSSVTEWTTNDVSIWLHNTGFQQYADLFAVQHKIDGATLLMLSEVDLRDPPLQIKCLGDIKRLGRAIYNLKNRHFNSTQSSLRVSESTSHEDVLLCVEYDQRRKMSISGENVFVRTKQSAIIDDALIDTISNSGDIQSVRLISRDQLIRTVESPDTKEKSLIKLLIAFFYCLSSLLITAFVMVLVHDRVPDMKMYPPLPDIVLDNLPLIPWAFDMCELIGVTLIVIMRRMFSLVGTVFLLRCITMLITSLSVPGVHLECRAKSYGGIMDKLMQAFHIWSRLGMSIQGVRTCGDYMFSGHTTAITLLNHFITEYTPPSWTFLHTATWVLNLFGIFFILAGHEHYSIDVFIAFYISSRMFLYYHAYAYNHANLTATDDRIRLWFPLGWFFEAGSIGKVQNEFEIPLRVILPRLWNGARNYGKKWIKEEAKPENNGKHSKRTFIHNDKCDETLKVEAVNIQSE